MVWSSLHDEILCREIMAVDPFTGKKTARLGEERNGKRSLKT